MATRNARSSGGFEGMDKLPSNTLKRHPKMELNKNDLLRLLSYLEGELQARDVVIAALKAEKAKQLLYQAKYGRFGLGDPFHSIQRDSDTQKDNSFDEAAVKSMYDNQLMQLENLIATQRKAQHRMREQLAAVEKRYHKVLAELEDEKRKHAQDTAQGDDVTYMLEKDRERLKNEVDFEKSASKKLEKELKKTSVALEEERAASAKHKQVAIMLIKERKRLFDKLVESQRGRSQAEIQLAAAGKNISSDTPGELNAHLQQMEAAMERQLSEFDVEREQHRLRLQREEKHCKDLEAELEETRQQVELLKCQLGNEKRASDAPQSIEIKSTQRPSVGDSIVGNVPGSPAAGRHLVYRNTPPNTPPEVRRIPIVNMHDSSERDRKSALNHPSAKSSSSSSSLSSLSGYDVKRGGMQLNSGVSVNQDKPPIPADKPDLLSGSRAISASGGTVFTSQSGGTTVFTTPSGTRISLNVGPSAASSSSSTSGTTPPPSQSVGVSPTTRKTSPLARGTPPPVPPNKPAFLPQSMSRIKDNPAAGRPSSAGGTSPRMDIPVIGKPAPPTKFGITISKDKFTISEPGDVVGHHNDSSALEMMTDRSSSRGGIISSHHSSSAAGPSTAADRKQPSQVCLNIK